MDDVEKERAAIVAWLRDRGESYEAIDEQYHANAVLDAADAIEAGGHLKEKPDA